MVTLLTEAERTAALPALGAAGWNAVEGRDEVLEFEGLRDRIAILGQGPTGVGQGLDLGVVQFVGHCCSSRLSRRKGP